MLKSLWFHKEQRRISPVFHSKLRKMGYRTRTMIRDGKTHQIRALQTTDDFECIDVNLAKLCRENKITLETAIKYCDSPNTVKSLVGK
jgi:Tfp pilus assembly pilus retraction ATPase PilT